MLEERCRRRFRFLWLRAFVVRVTNCGMPSALNLLYPLTLISIKHERFCLNRRLRIVHSMGMVCWSNLDLWLKWTMRTDLTHRVQLMLLQWFHCIRKTGARASSCLSVAYLYSLYFSRIVAHAKTHPPECQVRVFVCRMLTSKIEVQLYSAKTHWISVLNFVFVCLLFSLFFF